MNWGRHRERPARATYRPPEPMPQTAEGAHVVAKQWYGAMLQHAAAGRLNMAATAAACFQNAALLANMYELRQLRIGQRKLLHALRAAPARPGAPKPPPDTSWLKSTEDSHDLHPAAPKVPHDGYRVPRLGRMS